MAPVSRILQGLKFLRRDNPWPDFGYGEIAPFYLPLDGGGRGGRELILDAIAEHKVETMVEIGCFLGGSTLQWLRASDTMQVIGVDPWEGNWAAYIETLALDPMRARTVYHLKDEEIATIVANLRRHGNFCVAMNNLRLYKDRFTPVRRSAPEALSYLHARGIAPELIYIDADKTREALDLAHQLYPQAVLCGDDWLWPDETGALRMQEIVKAFAAEHGYEVRDKRQSWLLVAPGAAAPAQSE